MWFVCLFISPTLWQKPVGPSTKSFRVFRSLPVSSWQTNLQSEKHSKETWTKEAWCCQSNLDWTPNQTNLFNDKKKHKTPSLHTQLEQQKLEMLIKINKIAFNKVKSHKSFGHKWDHFCFVLSSMGWVGLGCIVFVEGRTFDLCSFGVFFFFFGVYYYLGCIIFCWGETFSLVFI